MVRVAMDSIIRDRWNGYTYLFGEDERCVVSFDVDACDPANQKPSQLRRVIGFSPEDHIGAQGMPSPASFARLRAIEDAMVEGLRAKKVRCWLIGRQVYRGMRELLFQVDDVKAFGEVYAAVEDHFGGMKLIEHADWGFFNDKIRPDERGFNNIANREVITGLKEAGSDLSAEHTLDHVFIGPSGALEKIATELAGKGFGEGSRHKDSMTISIAAALDDQDYIDGMTMFLRGVAATHGASYDGWGAAVLRP